MSRGDEIGDVDGDENRRGRRKKGERGEKERS